ncbi:pyrroline-5-carboxylate reductase family protein [Roseibium sp. M-1]
MPLSKTVGILGGSGQLGSALATAWLESGTLAPESLWISNRSGSADGFEAWPQVRVTQSNQALTEACDVIFLSVPPALLESARIQAPDKLVVSVMAGVSRARLTELTGSERAVRAMSSPAARQRLAYSPWCASPSLTGDDRETVMALLSASGLADEVPTEDQIEVFTAITGPVPGFVALFADCVVQYAREKGIAPELAVRAVKQLFLASGRTMAEDEIAPAAHVQEMIDYAGTTAAGLRTLRDSDLAGLIAEGLDASVSRVRTIARTT